MNEKSDQNTSDSQNYEQLVQEIEALDTYWGPTFRAIIEDGKHQKFLEHLEQRIRGHDRDIEKLCNVHYQGFIDSILELRCVRSEAKDLKGLIASMDKDLQIELQNVLQRGEEVAKARRVEANIISTIEQLEVCLPVFQMYHKLKEQLNQKRYYPALKSLEQLEHTYLPQVSRYRFTNHFRENIPKYRKKIQDSSMSELKDFLENVRKYSTRIGEVAMRHTAEQIEMDQGFLNQSKNKYKTLASNSFEDSEEGLSAQDLVDFSPLYRCLHIFTFLGDKQLFENYYRKQRKEQSSLVLQPVTSMHESLEGYREYFHAIVGFFVIENHLLYTTKNGLVSQGILEEMWSNSVPKIANILRTYTAYCTDAEVILRIKDLIMLFINTLATYGYNISQLSDTLLDIREHYTDVLMQRCVHSFREIFDQDTYHPLQVSNEEEYQEIVEVFPYRDKILEKSPFPLKFPFSSMVPRVYQQVKNFVLASLNFTNDLNLSQTEVDDMLRKSTNILLTRTLGGCLTTLIQKPSVGLLELIQITINTNYLEHTNVYLEDYISQITSSVKDVSHKAELQGKSMFKDARAEADQQIYEKLKAKIDETFDLANYEWILNEPQGRASDYIIDLVAFLQTTFLAFTNLPIKVARTACVAACQHINKKLLHMILNEDEVKQISYGALKQLDLDLIQCEQFASSEPVKDLDPALLLECFADIRQLVDLFNQYDFSSYFSDFGEKTSKYPRVTPQSAIKLLEKIREAEKDKKKILSVLKKDERDKRKLHESILKQLKELPQTSN